MYSEHLIILHDSSTHTYHTSHSYVHSHPYIILYNTLMYTSHLHFFCFSLQAGCSRLFVSYTVLKYSNLYVPVQHNLAEVLYSILKDYIIGSFFQIQILYCLNVHLSHNYNQYTPATQHTAATKYRQPPSIHASH
jgi:hypothetical protein